MDRGVVGPEESNRGGMAEGRDLALWLPLGRLKVFFRLFGVFFTDKVDDGGVPGVAAGVVGETARSVAGTELTAIDAGSGGGVAGMGVVAGTLMRIVDGPASWFAGFSTGGEGSEGTASGLTLSTGCGRWLPAPFAFLEGFDVTGVAGGSCEVVSSVEVSSSCWTGALLFPLLEVGRGAVEATGTGVEGVEGPAREPSENLILMGGSPVAGVGAMMLSSEVLL